MRPGKESGVAEQRIRRVIAACERSGQAEASGLRVIEDVAKEIFECGCFAAEVDDKFLARTAIWMAVIAPTASKLATGPRVFLNFTASTFSEAFSAVTAEPVPRLNTGNTVALEVVSSESLGSLNSVWPVRQAAGVPVSLIR